MLTIILFVLVFIVVLFALYRQGEEQKTQLKRQQGQLDELCQRLGHPELSSRYVSQATREKAAQLKNAKKVSEAVKVIRAATAMDLLEAKQYVDKL